MAGHYRLPPNALKHGQVPIDDVRLHNGLHHRPSTILEDRIAIQRRTIQTLLVDNQQLAAAHLALKQDLALSEDELRQSLSAADVKSHGDDQVRQLYEKSLQLDAEVRSIVALRGELAQVRADVDKLSVHRQELTAKLLAINGDLAMARTEAQQVVAVKAEIQAMKLEIQRGRAAIEHEKKLHARNLEHSQTMEQNRVALAREIEKLNAELTHAEKKSRAEAAVATAANPSPGCSGSYNIPEVSCGGNLCPDPCAIHQV